MAQSAEGTIVGRVQNANTRAFLEGAQVSVSGTSIRVSTGRDGSFTLSRVPAGSRTVTVTYTGLDASSQEVSVVAGKVVPLTITLGSEVYQLEQFTVAGLREGNAVSITKQRNAENIVNVVSMDTFGNVADGNIGNFLQNLPGVSANKEAGDIVGINVRGTPPDLNAVTLDGARTASAIAGFSPQGDRASLIDQIPSEFIKEIEVTKANTPEAWADSLGGSVNLITKSAFDFSDRVFSYRVGGSLNTYREGEWSTGWGPTMALTYMDTFGPERTFGVSLSLSDTTTTNARDRAQMQYRWDDDRNTNARTLNDVAKRQRQGVGFKVEYRPNPTLKMGFNTVINRYYQDMVRRNFQASVTGGGNIADYNVVSRAAIEAGAVPRTSTNAVAGVAPGFRTGFTELLNANWLNQGAMETKRSKQLKLGFDLETTWSDSKLEFAASFNPSSFWNLYEGFSATMTGRGVGMRIDTTNPERPVYTQSMGPTIGLGTNYSLYSGQLFENGPDYTEEDISSVTLDYTRDFRQFRFPIQSQAGVGYRGQVREWSTYRPSWDYVGADSVLGFNSATGRNDDEINRFIDSRGSYGLFNNAMQRFNEINYKLAQSLKATNPSYFRARGTSVSNVPPASKASEDVYAAYLQARIDMRPLTILTGVRMEDTSVKARGAFVDPLKPTVPQTTQTGGYTKFFPSIHLRYEPRPNLLFRGSFSTSSARPAIRDITPATTVSHNTGADGSGSPGTVRVNSSGLLPQYTENWDFSAEYYLKPVGVISAGYFRKNISDFIASLETLVGSGSANGFGGDYADYDLFTKTNLGSAQISGFELNYSQTLNMLPAPWNRLSVFANYTKLETSGTYANGSTTLAGFVPESTNAGVSFSWKRISTGVRYNLKSAYLRSLNNNPVLSSFVDEDPTVDFNFGYRISSAVSIYADLVNAFNKSPSWYNKSKNRIEMAELYGARFSVGISGRF